MKMTGLSAALAAIGLLMSVAAAQALQQTYVSRTGAGMTCSAAAPCADFQTAHDATDTGGMIICLDEVTQNGPLTITKTIEIDCHATHASIYGPSGGDAITINTAGVGVLLRGLDIRGFALGSIGIHFTNGAQLALEDCHVQGFNATGGGSGVGILFSAPTPTAVLHISNSVIHNNGLPASGGGIIVQPTGTGRGWAVIQGTHVYRNTYGIFANGSSSTANTSVQVVNSVVEGNSVNGVSSFTNGGVASTVVNNSSVLLNAGAGISAQGTNAFMTLQSSSVTSNNVGLQSVSGGQIFSYGDNHLNGNVTDGSVTADLPLR